MQLPIAIHFSYSSKRDPASFRPSAFYSLVAEWGSWFPRSQKRDLRTRVPGTRRQPATLSTHGGLDEEPEVEEGDDDGGGPGEALEPALVDEGAHEGAVTGEEDEGNDGEAELE